MKKPTKSTKRPYLMPLVQDLDLNIGSMQSALNLLLTLQNKPCQA